MMFNNHNDGIIKPILGLFKKSKNYHNHNYVTILVGLTNYVFILTEKIY